MSAVATEAAYRRLVEPHRRELHAHCYRMLGSVQDAEDALQEALLRAWRGLPRFEGRSSLRSWLFTIATNTCLTAIARRPKRALPIDLGPAADPHDDLGAPLPESEWMEPYPDEALRYEERESVELAFVAALQHLLPRQRAVLILREVLGFSAREVADALQTTVAAVNSAMQRARRAIDAELPERSQQAALRSLGDERLRDLVERYTDALESGDVAGVVALLTGDATIAMPPIPSWYRGHDAIAVFLARNPLAGHLRWRHARTTANGQPAVGAYTWDDERGAYVPTVLDVLTIRGDRIAAITAFLTPEIFPRFGLPPELPERRQ
jgi:RNA polymerase sigma-70 factor (ECF subfamily)